MATCYSGIGDTSRNELQVQNIEPLDHNAICHEDNEQINEIDNNAPQHMPEIQQLARQVEQLRQTMEDSENDPLDAIHELEQRLNQLTFVL